MGAHARKRPPHPGGCLRHGRARPRAPRRNVFRSAGTTACLYSWAFNKKAWQCEPAEEWLHALNWMKQNSLPVSALAEADVLRRALDAMCRKLDGKAAVARQPDARGMRSTKLSTLLWRKGTSRRTPQRSTVESARSQ